MKICPNCREEYLEHIEMCGACKETLLTEDQIQAMPHCVSKLLSTEEFLQETTLPLMEGGLTQCREMEKILKSAEISCVVYPVDLGCNDHGVTVGTTCAMKYMVLVRESDLLACKKALEGQFLAQVAREGQGEFVHDVVDLEHHEIQCPACGERGALKQGECGSCGLFLGEADNLC